jgi:hypothetical protein
MVIDSKEFERLGGNKEARREIEVVRKEKKSSFKNDLGKDLPPLQHYGSGGGGGGVKSWIFLDICFEKFGF